MSDDTITPSTTPPPPAALWVDQDVARVLIHDHAQLVGVVATLGRRLDERLTRVELQGGQIAASVSLLARERVREADAVLHLRQQATEATIAADGEVSQAHDRARVAEASRAAEVAELRTAALDTAGAGLRATGTALRSQVAPYIILAILSGFAGLGAGQSDLLGSLARAAVAALTPPLPPGAPHAEPDAAPLPVSPP